MARTSSPVSLSNMRNMHPMKGFNYFLIVSFIIVFFVTLGYPLGNEKFSDAVFGSYGSTGAAIIFVGMPFLLLHANLHLF